MYRVIKVLNNNGVLALDMEKKQEVILLGNGVGFGKKMGQRGEPGRAALRAGEKRNLRPPGRERN